MNRLGSVQTKITISLAVLYLIRCSPVMQLSIMPNARQQLMTHEELGESIRYPTFMANPKARAENISPIHGTTTKAAAKLHRDTICNFLFMSSIMFNQLNIRNMGRVQAGGGCRKWLKAIILMLTSRKFVSVFSIIHLRIITLIIIIYPIDYAHIGTSIYMICICLCEFVSGQQRQQNIMQVQYRNCNYIGDFDSQSYRRNGYGLLIFDNSHIIMAKWKSNSVHGPFVMITDRMRALGTMAYNKLQGYNVISIQESLVSNKKEKQRTVYGMFKDNKIYGKALIIDGDQFVIGHYVDGRLRQVGERKMIKDREVYDVLQAVFPNEIYNITDWLSEMFSRATREFTSESSYKYQPKLIKFENQAQFYGYSEIFNKNKQFGFVIHQGQVISIGDHENDLLEGIGRIYHSDDTVQDGIFKQGELSGIGISYSKKTHKYVLGENNGTGDEFEKGFGFPHKQIGQIRKQFHLRSIYFYNDIVLFSFSTLFEAITANALQYGIEHESPRFSSLNTAGNTNSKNEIRPRGLSQKSLLKSKIAQYEQQSQRIDGPSPMRNKQNDDYDKSSYQKLRNQRLNYLQNQQREPQPQPRSRSKSNNARSRFPDTIQQNTAQSRKVKDTRQLVRELDQKQKVRRNYLDKIYKDAKIYSRK